LQEEHRKLAGDPRFVIPSKARNLVFARGEEKQIPRVARNDNEKA
jgi:hypothetical protein